MKHEHPKPTQGKETDRLTPPNMRQGASYPPAQAATTIRPFRKVLTERLLLAHHILRTSRS